MNASEQLRSTQAWAEHVAPLYQPFTVRGLTLPNRIVMAPMGRMFGANGVLGEGNVDYYGRRAAGGTGLVIGEAVAVPHQAAIQTSTGSYIHGEPYVGVWTRIAAAVRAAGGIFFPQLWHAGLLRYPSPHTDPLTTPHNPEVEPIGPSGMFIPHHLDPKDPVPPARQVVAPMTQADIDAVIDAFATAAVTAQQIGCHGIEIHGAHGYLIDQFFWAETNRRSDQYGGSIANRSRFAAEIVREIRHRVGEQFPIFFRYSLWKQQNYGARLVQSPQELEQMLAPLVDAGVDLFDCSTRRFWEPEFGDSKLNVAGWTKKITGKPTMTVGSLGLEKDLDPGQQWQELKAAANGQVVASA
ncbi:MAG: hypothetical protein ABW049_11400, partial [Spongiibacteraceae bacterium]